MKKLIRIMAVLPALALTLAVTSPAQIVIGSWQNNTGDGWIDWTSQLSITNPVSNTNVSYSFVSGAVPGYAQSLQIAKAGYSQNLAIKLESIPGGVAAFLTNNLLSFTFSVPGSASSGATAGYSQIYQLALNASGFGFNGINFTNFTATGTTNNNSGGQPNFYFGSSSPVQSQTVTVNYSNLLSQITATPSSGYVEFIFTFNNGGGAATNYFINNVTLSKAGSVSTPVTVSTYTVDDFSPAGVGPQNATNYDYYSSSNNYAAGQITNVWGNWFGSAFQSVAWDSTSDASNNPNSGSLKVSLNFASTSGVGQFVAWDQGTVNNYYALNINAITYTNFQCDVRFAPSSASDSGTFGSPIFGHLRFGDRTTGYGQDWFGAVDVAATTTNWVHVSIPLNAITDTNLLNIQGLIFGIDTNYYNLNLNGASTLWVDNVKFTGPATAVTVTPPVLGIQPAVPALRVFAGSSANTYDREELTTVDQKQSWIGGAYPVTYSFTLLSAASAPGFQTAIFLIPTNGAGGNALSSNEFIDYQAAKSVWLQIQTEGNGVAIAQVAWKTNSPNINPNNVELNITNSTAVGTWTLQFTSATAGTLTAPGAGAMLFNIKDANVSSDFANPAIAIFGIQPNSTAGEGQSVDYSRISVTGVAGVNEVDNFTQDSVINTTYWDLSNSAQPSSLVLVTTNTTYWLNWTLPDTGFGLGTAESVLGNTNTVDPWMLPEYYNGYPSQNIPGATIQGSKKWLLIPVTCLPTVDGSQFGVPSSTAFFQLFNPPLVN